VRHPNLISNKGWSATSQFYHMKQVLIEPSVVSKVSRCRVVNRRFLARVGGVLGLFALITAFQGMMRGMAGVTP
jgi:hypothetical protein